MKLLDISLPLSYVVIASVSLLTTLSGCTLQAQELSPLLALSSKIEGPKPKILKPRPNARSRFALDRTSLALGLFQAGAELFDGLGTHRYVNAPSCRSCIEGDPVCRFFLGRRPTWPRMLTLGTLEVFGAAYLQQAMRRSPHKLLRWIAPATSLALTAIHIDQGVGVFAASTNPCSLLGPGYSVMSQSPTGDHVACTRPNVLLPVVQRTRSRH